MNSRTRGYLPHIIKPEGTYFVTFRLADSLPSSLVIRWKEELRSGTTGGATNLLKESNYKYQEAVQQYLDRSFGHCWLNKPEIALMVDRAIRHFDNQRYRLLAWTIMPNHVHILLSLPGTNSLSSIIHSWKSFTSHEANKVLGRTGEFWQREYFDRQILSQRQLEFTARYILNNPVKAGLCEEVSRWPWTGCSDEIQPLARRFLL